MELRNINNIEKKSIRTRQTDFDSNQNIKNTEDELKNEKNQKQENAQIDKTSQNDEVNMLMSKILKELNDKNDKQNNKNDKIISKENSKNKKENIHKNHRQRLKNQFLENGLASLTDVQKLELLLFFSIPQKDTNPIAHKLLDKFGSLKDVFFADYNKLIEVNGVKENSALLIKFVNSLLPVMSHSQNLQQINTAFEAKEFCSKLFLGVDVEQFYVICLSKNNQIKKYKMIQSGSADEINLQIRNITEFTLDSKCNRIIISHNHPNGKAIMSDEDCTFTYSLICSCMLNSIEVIDHIIVGIDSAISLASQRILQKLKESAFKSLNISKEQQLLISNSSSNYILDDSEK